MAAEESYLSCRRRRRRRRRHACTAPLRVFGTYVVRARGRVIYRTPRRRSLGRSVVPQSHNSMASSRPRVGIHDSGEEGRTAKTPQTKHAYRSSSLPPLRPSSPKYSASRMGRAIHHVSATAITRHRKSWSVTLHWMATQLWLVRKSTAKCYQVRSEGQGLSANRPRLTEGS